jgi:hypothetical protein
VIDPLIDDTARHPMAEPLREHLVAAGGLKLLRGDERRPAALEAGDSMAMTIPEDRAPGPPARRGARGGNAGRQGPKVAKGRAGHRGHGGRPDGDHGRGFRARAASLDLGPDPTPAPAFGDGILATQKKRALPWPIIAGAVALLIIAVALLAR